MNNMIDMYAKGYMQGEGDGRYQFEFDENLLPLNPIERSQYLEGYKSGYGTGRAKFVNKVNRVRKPENNLSSRIICSDSYMQGFYDGSEHARTGSEKDFHLAPENENRKLYEKGYMSGYDYGKTIRIDKMERNR